MNAYWTFKKELDKIYDELDTFLFILDKNLSINETVGDAIDRYIDTADRLKEAFENLKKKVGNIRIVDIEYDGKLRD